MTIEWSSTAELTYAEELDFINVKWGIKEVEKFILLADDFLETLSTGTFEGKPARKGTLRMSVISKQTSVYYKMDRANDRILLVSFWNNQKDSNSLNKLLDV